MAISTTITLSAVLAIIIGILVLAFPRFLRYAVGIYLIVIGILQLLGQSGILTSPY